MVELVGRGFRIYLRLIDSCITQLKAQGPSRTCNESEEEEEEEASAFPAAALSGWYLKVVVSTYAH